MVSRLFGKFAKSDHEQYSHHRDTLNGIVDEMEQLAWSIDKLADALAGIVTAQIERAAEGETEDPTPEGSFSYIPIALPTFISDMRVLDRALAADRDYRVKGRRYRPVRLCEIGCGHGRNLAVVRHADMIDWLSLSGFDISPRMIEVGRKAFGFGEDEIFVGDALKQDISEYDVIYVYRPFLDDKLQRKFEKHMLKSMKVSAYLVAPLGMTMSEARGLQEVDRNSNVWKKIA